MNRSTTNKYIDSIIRKLPKKEKKGKEWKEGENDQTQYFLCSSNIEERIKIVLNLLIFILATLYYDWSYDH